VRRWLLGLIILGTIGLAMLAASISAILVMAGAVVGLVTGVASVFR